MSSTSTFQQMIYNFKKIARTYNIAKLSDNLSRENSHYYLLDDELKNLRSSQLVCYNLSSSDFETLFVFSVACSWDFNFLFFWSDSKIISVLYSAILELSFENESQRVWFKDFFSNKRNIKMPKSQYFSWKIGRKNSYQITLLTKTNNKTKQFNSRSNK